MSYDLVDTIQSIYRHAIDRVNAGNAVRAHLERAGENLLRIGDAMVPVAPNGVYLIAFGKASVAMSVAALVQIGDLAVSAIAVTKSEADVADRRLRIMRGSHPVPDASSLAAGDAIAAFAESIPPGALVICLISGGGSALVESLREGVTLDMLRSTTQQLLRAGASIQELNAVRSRLSLLKAGGMLHLLSHTTVVNVIVSDVLGDDLAAIASGPTTLAGERSHAEEILTRYGVDMHLPPVEARDSMNPPRTQVVANIGMAVDAAREAATSAGFKPVVLTTSIDGEAKEVGRVIAAVVADAAAGTGTFPPGTCLLAGGEAVVTLRGQGIGGRNTEAALAAALRIEGVPGVALAFLATDGDDGISGAAGAIVTGDTIDATCRPDAALALANNDSFSFLESRGAAWVTGLTGTNVNDLVIGLIGKHST